LDRGVEHDRGTPGQVERSTRPDAIDSGCWYLIKAVPLMRLTNQVRLQTQLAQQNSARLVLVLRASAQLSADMQAFAEANAVTILRSNH
jgi:hypothetical protein